MALTWHELEVRNLRQAAHDLLASYGWECRKAVARLNREARELAGRS